MDSLLNSVECLTVLDWHDAGLGEHRLDIALDVLLIHVWHNLHPNMTHRDLTDGTTRNTLKHQHRNKQKLAFSEPDTILVCTEDSSVILFQLGQVEGREGHA